MTTSHAKTPTLEDALRAEGITLTPTDWTAADAAADTAAAASQRGTWSEQRDPADRNRSHDN